MQQINLNKTGDEFPYGQIAVSEAHACWDKAKSKFNIDNIRLETDEFNNTNKLYKKGISMMPICFGISFTNTMMNQGRALVHVYTDGSVSVSTGAVEMGQGVNTKMLQVVAFVFGINPAKIKLQSTSTSRVANTSPSAASATADLNGKAVFMACTKIANRLKQTVADEMNVPVKSVELKDNFVIVNNEKTGMDWEKLILSAFFKRVSLSEHAHYTTPEIHFDKLKEKGHPFAYHVYGTAITQVTIDCLRGTYDVDAVKVVHDFGVSMNLLIDRGQIEGGIVQGIGWMTLEELIYDKQGKLKSNTLSTYKVPDIYSAPKILEIDFLETTADNLAIFRSKAVGEPPLMYGIGTYFALRNAIKAYNPSAHIPLSAPMTPEKTLMALYSKPLKPDQEKNEETTSSLEISHR